MAGRRSGRAARRARSTTRSCGCSRSPGRRESRAIGRRTGWRSSGSRAWRRCAATMSERIYVGADHAGFQLKQRLVGELQRLGYEPVDVGPKTLEPADDYADYAKPVSEAVSKGDVQRA